MTASRDKFGRPIVVVTGMGVVTSLGTGKADNWTKLTAGESGIRTISRFPTDGLKTTMAGTVDFIPVEPFSSTDLSERLADIATDLYKAEGVGTAFLEQTAESPTGVGFIILNDKGENFIILDMGANNRMDPAFVDRAEPSIRDSDVVMAVLEIPVPAAMRAYVCARGPF